MARDHDTGEWIEDECDYNDECDFADHTFYEVDATTWLENEKCWLIADKEYNPGHGGIVESTFPHEQ